MLVLLSIGLAAPAPEGRFVVATEVLLPGAEWFNDRRGDFGFETRSWQLRGTVRCGVDEEKGRRVSARCTVERAVLQASAFQRTPDDDPAQTVSVLDELEERLSGYELEVELTSDGRVRRWDSVARPSGSKRETDTGWLVELMAERAVASLWLESPAPPYAEGQQFVEYTTNPLYVFPRLHGNFPKGTTTVLHQVGRVGEPTVMDSVVEGTYDTGAQLRVSGRSREWLDEQGALVRRTYSIDADLQDVTKYHHAGWVARIPDEATVDLGPTRHVRAPGDGPAADLAGLPEWPGLGEPPR